MTATIQNPLLRSYRKHLQAMTRIAEQPASEKRRLLEFVLSNSFWANGELTPEFRQPFDMLADMATVGAQKMAAGLLTSSHHQEELPDPYALREVLQRAIFPNMFWVNRLPDSYPSR